uniref:Integrase, catalytic region, zinc finger, CCHC-type, peptidase aspartic, catalytic n=1 Tax=Tanacetum cinerariifolium TaxID=118510 RepID=A0A699GVC1_TANCI|nr:integrase, catalytic region, zinc finger, CCHC-type, peptidase aspartic, catalytic [Tanacetum cinerariifolium]
MYLLTSDVDYHPVRDLAFNVDNIFQEDECDAFDSDFDDEPTTPSIFMANLSSAGPSNQQASPSNASILSEVHDLENAIYPCDDNQDEHEIHNEVHPKNIIESSRVHMGNSNVIPYEQYFSVNDVSVVPSFASSILNDAYVLHNNDVYVPHDPLAPELNIYKEQNNKIIEENVTALKQKFKQKETKFLTDLSNLKNLKDKLENKLYSQDQSTQTVHMMLKPTKLYDQDVETAIGVQNPFYLKKAKRAQPAYDGTELLKMHHVSVLVTSSKEDLELAETTRIKMNEKMNDHVCVEKRVKTTPPNYSKENFMAIFTPQRQLTLEQSGEIERKNLLIINENLIAKCIAQDVFYTVTNSAMTASRFHELSTAYTVAMNLDVELEVEKLKHQHLKENIENFKSKSFKDVLEFDAFFELGKWDDQIQAHKNTIRVSNATKARGSWPKSNIAHYRTLPANSVPKKKVEDHHRKIKSKLSKKNRVDLSTSIRHTVFNTNSNLLFKTCTECISSFNHDQKIIYLNWHHWKPTGRTFPLGAQCPLTRNTTPKVLPVKQWKPTGRLIPLKGQCPLIRPTALTSDTMLAEPHVHNTPVEYNLVCTNQHDPNYLVRGLPRLKFEKDHLCSECQLEKSKKATHQPKTINTIMEVLHRLHIDLCEPLRGKSINGKKFILVIIDDYSRFTWVKFLRSKDETPEFVVKLLKQLQVGLNKTVRHPMFDEYFKPSTVDQQVPPAPVVHILVNPPCPLVSIPIDQDAPSEEVNPFDPADNEPFVNIFAPDPSSVVSSSGKILISKSNQSTQPHEHL